MDGPFLFTPGVERLKWCGSNRVRLPGDFYFYPMPKRLTDTEKWNDPWFCGLNPKDKLFWIYLCDNCDHAGIWKVNWPLAKFHLEEYIFKPDNFNGRIEFLSEETWFIKKFVFFQQKVNNLKDLNPLNKCHSSILNILTSKGLVSPFGAPSKGLTRGYSKGNSKGKGKEGGVGETKEKSLPSLEKVKAYCLERKNSVDPQKWHDFYSAKGWMIGKNKMKDWRAAVRTWENKVDTGNWTAEGGRL